MPEAQTHDAVSKMITAADVRYAPAGSEIVVSSGARITPEAQDLIDHLRLRLVERPTVPPPSPAPSVTSSPTPVSPNPQAGMAVALGADHGGFAMKEDIKKYLLELGYTVVDCGTHSTDSVDYPDFAYAVAGLVAEGRANRGIMVDGAGIGSCMVANKVPGVRAAMCYDVSTAINSREHNDANVLTLGGGLIGMNLARQIVHTWLTTAFAGGRHANRVNKIIAVERRYLQH